eukprot:1181175-Prorocentrum_minimum.AAC.1
MVVPSPGITLAGSPNRDNASGCLVRYNIAGQGTISVTLASTPDDHATVMQLLGRSTARGTPLAGRVQRSSSSSRHRNAAPAKDLRSVEFPGGVLNSPAEC